MKKLFSLLLLVLSVSVAFSQNTIPSNGSEYCSKKKCSAGFLMLSPENPAYYPPVHSYDVQKYTLSLNLYHCYITPYPHDFTANEIIDFIVDSTLNSITLNANDTSLSITSVGGAGTTFTHANDLLVIHLDRTYNPGEAASVTINYSHKNYPDYSFYVNSGMVFTDCEPEGARGWFPCWDRPSDKAKLELTAKVKSDVKLGSNGALMDSTFSGDTLIYHWQSIHNIATYLMVMSSKVGYNLDIKYWHKLSNPSDSIPLRFYFNTGETPYAMEDTLVSMITYYSQEYCEHPFQKNGFAALNSDFPWGGMENQTLTSICPNCWEEGLMSHEFAHQWFGDMITCATWADIWLNEGFATWSEAHWKESYMGYSGYKATINGDATNYFGGNPGWAISDSSWAINTPPVYILFDYSITYCKGACVLHQLRYVLGDSLFFAVLHAYCADTNLRFKSATIRSFNDKVNQVTGQNYDWYFAEWIYKPNHPVYSNTYNFKDLGNGTWQAHLFLTQVQTNAPFFKMPVQVRMVFADLTDTLFRVMNDTNDQGFTWVFNKQPVILQFDPYDQIVLKQGSTMVGIPEASGPSAGAELYHNIPNPVRNTTEIDYRTVSEGTATLEIFDQTGRMILRPAEGMQEAGLHHVTVDCSGWASGIYIIKLTAGGEIRTGRMTVAH